MKYPHMLALCQPAPLNQLSKWETKLIPPHKLMKQKQNPSIYLKKEKQMQIHHGTGCSHCFQQTIPHFRPFCFMPLCFNAPSQFTQLCNLHSLIYGLMAFGWLHTWTLPRQYKPQRLRTKLGGCTLTGNYINHCAFTI